MEKPLEYGEVKDVAGLSILYDPSDDGSVTVRAVGDEEGSVAEVSFTPDRLDEAHILWMESTELLRTRAKIGQDPAVIKAAVKKLFALFRGEKVSFDDDAVALKERKPSGDFTANPGKQIDIDVDGTTYARLPVKTRVITMADKDILPLMEEYVKPYLAPGDVVYVSEKALTITQGRIVSMSDVKPTALARFLARNVGNAYGTDDFHGFGHGTAIAMEAFISEAGYARAAFAAAVAAVTRPFGIKGMFYRICGKRAKSVDCPMSFLILEYAHSVKLPPNDAAGNARRLAKALGCDVVILDANYRGAFSLGKSSRAISEAFIGKLFRDNPLGQSDEMTPFCIVRKRL
jgi:hypothetical protein